MIQPQITTQISVPFLEHVVNLILIHQPQSINQSIAKVIRSESLNKQDISSAVNCCAELINQSNSQTLNEPFIQSNNQSIKQSITEPFFQSVNEPTNQSIDQSEYELLIQLMNGSNNQSNNEPINQSVDDSATTSTNALDWKNDSSCSNTEQETYQDCSFSSARTD
jgi:hypothetical protein